MAKKKNWIKGAIKHPGALKRKAKAAGESLSKFMSTTKGKSKQTVKQINLARTLKKLRKGKKK